MARAQLGVNGHLFAGHGVQGETGPHFRNPFGTLRNHDELDQGQNEEDHGSHHQVAGHHEIPESVNDLPGIGFE